MISLDLRVDTVLYPSPPKPAFQLSATLQVQMWRLYDGDNGYNMGYTSSRDDVTGKANGSVFRVRFNMCSKIRGAVVVEDGIAVVKGGVLEMSRSKL